jgi:Fe-S-cluster containining protein
LSHEHPRFAATELEQAGRTTDELIRRRDGRVALRLVDELGAYLDALTREAPEAARWACQAGCSLCCHTPVIATVPELVRLAAAVDAHVDADKLRARVFANDRVITELDDEHALFVSRLPCALLDEAGRCSVYAARPLTCRAHVSMSLAPCEAAHADPEADVGIDGDPLMQQARTDADTQLAAGLIVAGFDGMGYELHAGLARTLVLGSERALDPRAFTGCRVLSPRVEFDMQLRELISGVE